jgi:hypothetical protein
MSKGMQTASVVAGTENFPITGHSVYLPEMRLVNPCNSRQHWRVVARRAREQRALTHAILTMAQKQWTLIFSRHAKVTLTRIAKRKMDSDGLAASFKAVRDGVADVFGIDDGSDYFEWHYEQKIEKYYGVEIRIEPK